MAAILTFGSIFQKSLAHLHVARNGMMEFQKNLPVVFEFLKEIGVDLWRPFCLLVVSLKNNFTSPCC